MKVLFVVIIQVRQQIHPSNVAIQQQVPSQRRPTYNPNISILQVPPAEISEYQQGNSVTTQQQIVPSENNRNQQRLRYPTTNNGVRARVQYHDEPPINRREIDRNESLEFVHPATPETTMSVEDSMVSGGVIKPISNTKRTSIQEYQNRRMALGDPTLCPQIIYSRNNSTTENSDPFVPLTTRDMILAQDCESQRNLFANSQQSQVRRDTSTILRPLSEQNHNDGTSRIQKKKYYVILLIHQSI